MTRLNVTLSTITRLVNHPARSHVFTSKDHVCRMMTARRTRRLRFIKKRKREREREREREEEEERDDLPKNPSFLFSAKKKRKEKKEKEKKRKRREETSRRVSGNNASIIK